MRYATLAADRSQLPHGRRNSEEAVIQRLRTAFTVWPLTKDTIFTATLKYENRLVDPVPFATSSLPNMHSVNTLCGAASLIAHPHLDK